MPKPTWLISDRRKPEPAIADRIAWLMLSRASSGPRVSVGRCTRPWRQPRESTTAAATLLPPTSTPTTGSDAAPDSAIESQAKLARQQQSRGTQDHAVGPQARPPELRGARGDGQR